MRREHTVAEGASAHRITTDLRRRIKVIMDSREVVVSARKDMN